MSDLFSRGVEALKLEDKVRARSLLAQAVKEDPKNKNAWLWLSRAVEDEQQQVACFHKVLEIDPQNEYAKRGLQHIQSKHQESLNQSTGQLSQISALGQDVSTANEKLEDKNGDSETGKSRKVPLWVVVIVLVSFLALCGMSLLIPSIGGSGVENGGISVENESRTVSTQKGTFLIPGNGFIDGRDVDAVPALTIMEVRVWDGVDAGRRTGCKIPHGTAVQILDVKQDPDVGSQWYHFQVQSGSCRGWVTWWFVSTEKYEPIGDRIYD